MYNTVVKALGSDAGKLVRSGNKREEKISVGTGAVRSKEWKANVEQSRDPGMRGTGTIRVVSPAWRVFFL